MTSISGWWANHATVDAALRSGRRAITRCRARSTRIVPKRRPLRQAHSSSPSSRTSPTAGRGVARIKFKMVAGLVRMPRVWASRAPASPPRALPICCTAARKPWLQRPCGTTSSGRRSVKMRRGHEGMRQKKRRTRRRRTTTVWDTGRSDTIRAYQLWTLRERRPHSGQRADAFVAVPKMLIVSPVMSISSRWKCLSWGKTLVSKDMISMTKG